jgi:hypothetical protein
MAGILHEDRYTYMIIPRSVLPGMRNVPDKIKTHILCSINIFLNRAVYEIMWKNIVERDDNMTHAPCMLYN